MIKALTLSSPSFENQGFIPKKYSGNGEEINPPLHIEGLPQETKSLVLTLIDMSIPFGSITHWVIWNIPPTKDIEEDCKVGVLGKNSFGKNAYLGPKPLFGTHKYLFRVYALDVTLPLDKNNCRKDVEKVIENHIIEQAELCGLYKK